jgi:hypothetical protein
MANSTKSNTSLASISLKTMLVHTVTYFALGLISSTVFDYATRYSDPLLGNFMRQINHPLVAAGPMLQVFRGLLFGLVFYLLRDVYFGHKKGWLTAWAVLVIVGIISTFGPSPCSIEGFIYTNVPLNFHLIGLPEVVIQSFLLAYITHYWVTHPEKKWLAWIIGIVFALVVLMSALGILAGLGILQVPV